jgi:uncharacterized protein (DUF885 family)
VGQIGQAAVRFLMEACSRADGAPEVERYLLCPGQATSYFYGYTRWMQLKSQVEFALRRKIDRQRFHDFILSQGFLPRHPRTGGAPAVRACRAGAPLGT